MNFITTETKKLYIGKDVRVSTSNSSTSKKATVLDVNELGWTFRVYNESGASAVTFINHATPFFMTLEEA